MTSNGGPLTTVTILIIKYDITLKTAFITMFGLVAIIIRNDANRAAIEHGVVTSKGKMSKERVRESTKTVYLKPRDESRKVPEERPNEKVPQSKT